MKQHARMVGCALLVAATAAAQSPAKTYDIKATPGTTFYRFLDASTPPVVTINSGDIVRLETATGTPTFFARLGVPKEKIPAELYTAFGANDDGARRDHTLTGPIYVTGAAPGDFIEVRLRSIELRLPIGGSSIGPNGGTLPGEFPTARNKVVFLDLKNKTAEYAPGVVVPLGKPFWGSIVVQPPASMGRLTDQQPNVFGGNMDNSDLVAGTTLYLPVFVPGALLSLGDGHAAQGARRGRWFRDRDVAQGRNPGRAAQGSDHQATARRNTDRVHDHGVQRGSRRGGEDSDPRDDRLDRRDERDQPRRRVPARERGDGLARDTGRRWDEGYSCGHSEIHFSPLASASSRRRRSRAHSDQAPRH
jgi:hypothetical protein